jgi:cytochrome c oxidase subunit 1
MAREDGGSTSEGNPVADVASIARDGAIGAAAGFAGTAAMTVVLLVGAVFGAFDLALIADLAAIVGLGEDRVVGYVLFAGAGMTVWPLLFAAIGERVPGGSAPLRGVSFGTVMWSGFVAAFYTGQSGSGLASYALFTLLAHWAYGFVLGAVLDALVERVPEFDLGNAPLA